LLTPELTQVDVNQDALHKKQIQLSTKPITIVESDREYHTGDVIAVNESFICYAVKGAKIRVLARHHTARALLRTCEGEVADLRFVGARVNTLVGVSSRGQCCVWSLRLESGAAAPVIVDTLLGQLQLADGVTANGIERVAISSVDASNVFAGVLFTDQGVRKWMYVHV
jgi:hypothetical protein